MKHFPAIAVALVLVGLVVVLRAGAAPNPPSCLHFLTIPGSTPLNAQTLHYEAGSVDVVRTPHWKHTFTLQNSTSQSVTIVGLRGSCGCETLLLAKGGAQVRLAPGEKADVLLDIHLTLDQSGLVRKYVWVYGTEAGQAAPLATLELDMALRQSVFFTPNRLSFGKVPSGAGASQEMTVTLDADLVSGQLLSGQLLSGRSLPPLVSSDPAIHAVPVGQLQKITVKGQAAVCQRYVVTVSPAASAGDLSTELRFQAPPSTDPGDTALMSPVLMSPVLMSPVLMSPVLPVAGTIDGNLDAMPASVFFGSLPAGAPAKRTVVLSLASVQSVGFLRVSCSAPWLYATLNQSETAARHHLLTVTLARSAPAGLLQGTITIVSGKNDRVTIPVIAELTK